MPKQILLADDSITIQKVIALTFAGEDYKITAVSNGADAVTKAREIRPDIILADVVMPQKNGYEVTTEIKNDPDLRSIPVLLLAGTFEPFDEEEAKKVGADGFIIKPFESQALISKVKELIAAGGGAPAAPAPPKAAPPVQPPAAVSPKAAPAPVPAAKPQPTVMPVSPAPPKPAPPVQPPAPVPPKAAPAPVVPPRQPVQPPTAPIPPKVAAPPVVKPSAVPIAPPVAPKPPAPPVVAPEPAEEDIWGTMMEEVEGKIPEVKPAPAKPPVAAAPSADVWDMGELEEAPAPAAKGDEELWESFAFEDTEMKEEVKEAPVEEEIFGEEAFGIEEEHAEAVQEATEEDVMFGVEEVTEEEVEEIPEMLEAEAVEFLEEPVEAVVEEPVYAAPAEFELTEEPVESYAAPEAPLQPQPEFLGGFEETFEPEPAREVLLAPASKPAPLPSAVPLSEDQLRAAISQLSREVIEKIVWEVVPDMAEMLIKDEIKRLQKKQ